ncbi:MAG: ice-binding family protein [Actinomycetota bacterium]
MLASRQPEKPVVSSAPLRRYLPYVLLATFTVAILPPLAVTALQAVASTAQAGPPPVLLGSADGFAVLGGSTITNTGPTVINGDLGLHPGSAVIGFSPGTVNGAQHVSDAVAQQAKTDLTTAYNDAAGRPLSATSPPDIGGRTLTAGVYRSGSVPSLGLTGRLTLDAQGDPRAVFIFQIASTLVTATDSSISLINGAQACNVFWQVGSSATLGTRTAFQGNILALTSISMNDGVTVDGSLLARNGAVTAINDTVTRSRCAAGTGTGPAPQVLDVRLSKPAVIGRDTSIVVEAIDTRAPVSGMSVQFGSRRDVFGSSACRALDSERNVPRAFRPGVRTRLAAPHRFRKRGKQKVLVRVDSGGCSSPPTSVYQTVTVTPTSPGERPRPLIVDAPTLVKPSGALLPPILPARQVSSSGCSGSGKRLGSSRASRRTARRALLCLLNKTRRAHGLRRLLGNPRLLRAAERHSRSMVERRYFSHVEPGGLSPLDRILRTGYLRGARTFSCGENLGFGQGPSSSPRSMMRAWMNSTGHRANILTGSFREVGLGVVPGIPGSPRARGGTYTTVFGGRR